MKIRQRRQTILSARLSNAGRNAGRSESRRFVLGLNCRELPEGAVQKSLLPAMGELRDPTAHSSCLFPRCMYLEMTARDADERRHLWWWRATGVPGTRSNARWISLRHFRLEPDEGSLPSSNVQGRHIFVTVNCLPSDYPHDQSANFLLRGGRGLADDNTCNSWTFWPKEALNWILISYNMW